MRRVDANGVMTTHAGGGVNDGGGGDRAALGCPSDLAVVMSVPAAGTIYIADSASCSHGLVYRI